MSDRPAYDQLVKVMRDYLHHDDGEFIAIAIIDAVIERLRADCAIGFGAIRIADAQMSVRTEHALLAAGFVTLGDLTKKTVGDLLRTPGIGRKVLAEVTALLHTFGLSLKAEP